jgi:hypothetical protein
MLETSVARDSISSSSVATHPSAFDRSNGCHTGSRVRSDQDRLLQRCPGRNHEATTEPASDGSQHCSSSTPANTEVRKHIVGDHKHLTLVACARSPHLQNMLSRLEQCCGCWSEMPILELCTWSSVGSRRVLRFPASSLLKVPLIPLQKFLM